MASPSSWGIKNTLPLRPPPALPTPARDCMHVTTACWANVWHPLSPFLPLAPPPEKTSPTYPPCLHETTACWGPHMASSLSRPVPLPTVTLLLFACDDGMPGSAFLAPGGRFPLMTCLSALFANDVTSKPSRDHMTVASWHRTKKKLVTPNTTHLVCTCMQADRRQGCCTRSHAEYAANQGCHGSRLKSWSRAFSARQLSMGFGGSLWGPFHSDSGFTETGNGNGNGNNILGGTETVYNISESKPGCMCGLIYAQVHRTTPEIETKYV
eukprot:364426-Chlamydomonas_euryale.AAC.50